MDRSLIMTGETKGMKQVIDRLDRFESKLDSIQTALVELARTEERVVQLMDKDARREAMINEMQKRLGKLETAQAENQSKIAMMWTGLGVAVSAIIGLVTALIKGVLQ
jgi:chromosome segregation ATPase